MTRREFSESDTELTFEGTMRSATFPTVTVTEAAQRLGLSPRTLQEQIKRGRIKATRHGPIWWITEAEVERYRAESKGKPGRRRKP